MQARVSLPNRFSRNMRESISQHRRGQPFEESTTVRTRSGRFNFFQAIDIRRGKNGTDGDVRPSVLQKDLVLRREPVLGEQMHGDFAEIPYDAEPGENLQGVISDVNLPPKEAMARRGHEVMMVVVPAFAQREQREQPVVLAGVAGFVAARTKKVRE